mmetsp:Transcript_136947/g.238029  ORF Transcript_136947/g.238029 Transcript_136947/m.238029 type:complete len:119 (+) Transcript_136947:3661-4017(+)
MLDLFSVGFTCTVVREWVAGGCGLTLGACILQHLNFQFFFQPWKCCTATPACCLLHARPLFRSRPRSGPGWAGQGRWGQSGPWYLTKQNQTSAYGHTAKNTLQSTPTFFVSLLGQGKC